MLPTTGQFEHDPSSELDELAACARLLDLGEYRIFQAAYRAWFGHEPSEAELKPGFATYLRSTRLPPWVRHYCRQVIAEAKAAGVLRPSEARWRALADREIALTAATCVLLLSVLTLT